MALLGGHKRHEDHADRQSYRAPSLRSGKVSHSTLKKRRPCDPRDQINLAIWKKTLRRLRRGDVTSRPRRRGLKLHRCVCVSTTSPKLTLVDGARPHATKTNVCHEGLASTSRMEPYTWQGSNWRPSACEADVIATRPQVPCILSHADEYRLINIRMFEEEPLERPVTASYVTPYLRYCACKANRHRRDSNPCGQSPMDF